MKYRRSEITNGIWESLKEIWLQISEQYEMHFVEIGYKPERVQFGVQSIPNLNVQR